MCNSMLNKRIGVDLMIDIHSHILPNVDDGPNNLEESIEMAKKAFNEGIKFIVATPHHQNGIYNNDYNQIINKTYVFNQRLKEEDIKLTVLPGQEIRIFDNLINNLEEGKLLSINDRGKYILVEFPSDRIPIGEEQLIFDIQVAGYIPIIVHPERNEEIRRNSTKLYQLVKKGALTQITTGSILGYFGKDIYKFTLELIDHNLTHFLATDAHTVKGKRGINLKKGYAVLKDYAGEETVNQFKRNAKMIVSGKDIYVDEPYRITNRKRLRG